MKWGACRFNKITEDHQCMLVPWRLQLCLDDASCWTLMRIGPTWAGRESGSFRFYQLVLYSPPVILFAGFQKRVQLDDQNEFPIHHGLCPSYTAAFHQQRVFSAKHSTPVVNSFCERDVKVSYLQSVATSWQNSFYKCRV